VLFSYAGIMGDFGHRGRYNVNIKSDMLYIADYWRGFRHSAALFMCFIASLAAKIASVSASS
jgi:hypothetical protein